MKSIKKIIKGKLGRLISSCVRQQGLNESTRSQLTYQTLHSVESGVSYERVCDEELVVSLTTYQERYYDVYLAIESVMQGTIKPNRIVLYVSEELKEQPIPVTLQNQMKRGLEIRFVKDILSYTKLIYALKDFPDAAIVTIDDDIMYEHCTLEHLVNCHKANPGMICANDMYEMPDDVLSTRQPMVTWPFIVKYPRICSKYVFEGYAGVLYPPHTLSDEVFNQDVFMNICFTSDDVWFSVMAMLKGTKCAYACPYSGKARFAYNEYVQGTALNKINALQDDINIHSVMKKYSL